MKIMNRSITLLFLTFLVHLNYAQEVKFNYQAVVHTFNEAWNSGNYDLLDEVVHPDYVKLEGDMELKGVESLKEFLKNYRNSYEEVKITYIDEIYGDQKAAINFTIEGIPKETGKKFKAEGIVIFRFLDGKIIEDHSVFDQLSALKQQGYKIVDPE